MVGKRAVEVVWNGKGAGRQTERAGGRWNRRNRPKFRNWQPAADNNDAFPCLHAIEEGGGVMGEFSQAYIAHATIVINRVGGMPFEAAHA